jgi:hypothetical protein
LENRVPLVLVVEVLFVFVLLLRMLSTLKGNVTPYMPTHAPIVFGTAKVQNVRSISAPPAMNLSNI